MPSDSTQIIKYAAGASLAALTLIYVFAPTLFYDPYDAPSSGKRKGFVGLVNPANDCFINSVLQALAGSPKLRAYLSQRAHFAQESGELLAGIPEDQFVTLALDKILAELNERPLYRKTISAKPFVHTLERRCGGRISREQQDAHEFLGIVAEKLEEEYVYGNRWREKVREKARREKEAEGTGLDDGLESEAEAEAGSNPQTERDFELVEREGSVEPLTESEILAGAPPADAPGGKAEPASAGGESPASAPINYEALRYPPMPLAGKYETNLTCLTCKFSPRRDTRTDFLALTLTVPHTSRTSLSRCLDSLLSSEHIDDYLCPQCLIQYHLQQLPPSSDLVPQLEAMLADDPEKALDDFPLPRDTAPRRRISKQTRITTYPDVLCLHLSRSIYDLNASRKNSCRVEFGEKLSLGGLVEKKKEYRLVALVTHRGGHEYGHYECFRRQQPSANFPSTAAVIAAEDSTSAKESMSEEQGRRRKKRTRKEDRWWRISDDKAKECRLAEVLSMEKDAYLMFYERVKSAGEE